MTRANVVDVAEFLEHYLSWSLVVACHPLWSLVMHSSPVTCAIFLFVPVKADRDLVKDVLTCCPLVESVYKGRHPDDTDDPEAVGLSSEDEAEDMGEVLGVSRRLPVPVPPSSSLRQPESEGEPGPSPEDDTIKVPKKDLKRAQNIIKDMLAGKKARWGTAASKEDIPFSVPEVLAGETSCQLCYRSFSSTRSLRRHMLTHTGDTGFSCDRCGKILASSITLDMHLEGCGRAKNHFCMECNRGYISKQVLVAHLKAKHGPEPAPEDLVCPTCGKVFKVVKTMHEHLAVHRGPYPCLVEGCSDGPFSLPKCLNRHMAEKHGFSARRE